MPNDAKLGMLVGVLGVLVAAVVLSQSPGQPANPQAKEKAGAPATHPADTAAARLPPASAPEPQSSPVPRTKKDVDAQPTSRQGMDEEP